MISDETILQTVKRFREYLDELPLSWHVGTKDSMRFFAIDDVGELKRVPAKALEGFGLRAAKDSMAFAASLWCARHQPAAVIFVSEMWWAQINPAQRAQMIAREGGTPSMMEAATRARLRREYGAKIGEALLIQGE